MYGYSSVSSGSSNVGHGLGSHKMVVDEPLDLEEGKAGVLHPGLTYSESQLRWGFIRKVYGIVTAQLILTTIVSSAVIFHAPLNNLLNNSPGLMLAFAIVPMLLLIPLYHYQQKHPVNLVLLAVFTIFLSLSVGVACANTQGAIVLEALVLTSVVVTCLTGYTFWATKRGKDFNYLGPALFSGLMVLILTGFMQVFFPLGSVSTAIYGGLGALIFSVYIVYDTDNLIKRFTYDEYIWASVGLYLDILNLFLQLLRILRSIQSDA